MRLSDDRSKALPPPSPLLSSGHDPFDIPEDLDGLEKMKELSMGRVVKLHHKVKLMRQHHEKKRGVDSHGNEVVRESTSLPLNICLKTPASTRVPKK